MSAEFLGLTLMLCLITCYWRDKKQQKCFLNIQLEAKKNQLLFYLSYKVDK